MSFEKMPVVLVLVLCLYSSVRCADAATSQPSDPSLKDFDRDRYVVQKFERIERLLLQKDDRISQLEAKLASHMTAYTNYVTNNAIEMELINSALAQLQHDVRQKDQLLQKLRQQVVDLETVVSNRDTSRETLPFSTDDDVIPIHKAINEPLITTLDDTELIDVNRASEEMMNGGLEPNHTTNMNFDTGGMKVMSVFKNDDVVMDSISNEAVRPEDEQGVDNRGTGQLRVAPNPVTDVAFHAEMTVTGNVVKGSILVYNHEILDHGDGYSATDGMYLVPESGTYVITWTTVTYHDYVQTLLEVNGATRGSSMTDAQEVTDIHQTTMIVVLALNVGDHVFIRAGSLGNGSLHTTAGSSKPSFSGWKLFAS